MSQQNVQIVRDLWRAYRERGFDAAFDYYADDCIIEDMQDLPDGRTYAGGNGVRDRYWHFVEIWGNFSIEPLEFIDGDGNSVVVVAAMTGRAPASGLPLDAPAVFLYDVRDRKIVRDRVFTSKRAALEAVDLLE